MINVDEVTASRLVFAPMGVFLGRCCENAASKKVQHLVARSRAASEAAP